MKKIHALLLGFATLALVSVIGLSQSYAKTPIDNVSFTSATPSEIQTAQADYSEQVEAGLSYFREQAQTQLILAKELLEVSNLSKYTNLF